MGPLRTYILLRYKRRNRDLLQIDSFGAMAHISVLAAFLLVIYAVNANYYDYDYAQYGYNYDGDYGLSSAAREGDYGDYYNYGSNNEVGKSGHHHHHAPKKQKIVPVIIKKKKPKKTGTISTYQGMYIVGGTPVYGKFRDLKSCEKACDLTPTCFAGDYNTHTLKCYMHSNTTGCTSMKTHPSITHFKRVPCGNNRLIISPRSLITLGVAVLRGIEQKGITSLLDCLKKCSTAGNGIAPAPASFNTHPQLCFGIDYDFSTHTCFFHTHLLHACGAATLATIVNSIHAIPNPTVINILICPIAED